MPNVIRDLWVFLGTNDEGDECVLATRDRDGVVDAPVVNHTSKLDKFRRLGRHFASEHNQPIRVVRFSVQEVSEVIDPPRRY
jgi:hypothetical protein